MLKHLKRLHLKKHPEYIFTPYGELFDHKMSQTDDIAAHIHSIVQT